jgi:hypothetical protein
MGDTYMFLTANKGLTTAIKECSQHAGQSSAQALELLDESISTICELMPTKPRLCSEALGEHVPAARLKPDALTALQSAGANMDWRNDQGWTALQQAVSDDDYEAADNLHAHGANLNAPFIDAIGSGTTLHLALRLHDKPEVLEQVLQLGTDPNARDPHGAAHDTPLERILRNDYLTHSPAEVQRRAKWTLHVVTALTQFGADLNLANDEGEVPLDFSVEHGYVEDASLFLLNEGRYEQEVLDRCLHEACKKNWRTFMRAVVEAGADPCEVFEGSAVLTRADLEQETRLLANSLVTERQVSTTLSGNTADDAQSRAAKPPSPL